MIMGRIVRGRASTADYERYEPMSDLVADKPTVEHGASSGAMGARAVASPRTILAERLAEHALWDDRPLAWRRHLRRSSSSRMARLFATMRCSDRGAATAEFAVILPSVVAIGALLLCMTRTVIVSMDCQDAAAQAARELVVGGGDGDADAVARMVAGDGAAATVSYDEDRVTVLAQCPVIPDPLGVLPTRVSGTATGVMS